MKYIIDVPDEHTDIKVFYTDADMKIIQSMRCKPYTEPDRKAIEDEVWKMARLISYDGGLKLTDLYECYKCSSIQEVMKNHSYQEAKEKYEAWLKKTDEIRVGDEVIDKDVGKAIVINIDFELCSTLWLDGSVSEDVPLKDLHKTGRHFDEVEELLKKMKEGDRP